MALTKLPEYKTTNIRLSVSISVITNVQELELLFAIFRSARKRYKLSYSKLYIIYRRVNSYTWLSFTLHTANRMRSMK